MCSLMTSKRTEWHKKYEDNTAPTQHDIKTYDWSASIDPIWTLVVGVNSGQLHAPPLLSRQNIPFYTQSGKLCRVEQQSGYGHPMQQRQRSLFWELNPGCPARNKKLNSMSYAGSYVKGIIIWADIRWYFMLRTISKETNKLCCWS
jgi:hypothetical protein